VYSGDGVLASQFHRSKLYLKSEFLQTKYLQLRLKVNSIKQSSMPESRYASLHSVKVIKMLRLAIEGLLVLWTLYKSIRCCETDYKKFMSLDRQDVEKGNLRCAQNSLRVFNYAYVFRVIAS